MASPLRVSRRQQQQQQQQQQTMMVKPVDTSSAVSVSAGAPLPSPQSSPLSRRLSLANLALSFTSGTFSMDRSSPTSGNSTPTSPTQGVSSQTDTTPRGLSEIFSSVFKRDQRSAVWWGVVVTPAMQQLEAMISDRELRSDLVMDLLSSHSEFVLPIRFVTAFAEYQNTPDKKERQMKGRKILSTFIQPGCKFQLKCIPEDDLVHIRVEDLGMIKRFLLSEMTKDPLISDYIARYAPLADEPVLESQASSSSLASTPSN